jgi:hypothetical protein
MKITHVRSHPRRAPKPARDDAFYDMLAKLAGADEQDLARELDRELSGISREELEQIAGRR